jgi:hypothetical protein
MLSFIVIHRHALWDTASTQMKNGVPINAVRTPRGTSIFDIVRARVVRFHFRNPPDFNEGDH